MLKTNRTRETMCVFALAVLNAHLAVRAGTTNEDASAALMPLSDDSGFRLEQRPPLSGDFVKRFCENLALNQDAFRDTFGPPSYFRWARLYQRGTRDVPDHANSSGMQMLSDMAEDSAREASLSLLPIEEWEYTGGFLTARAAEMIVGTLGSTAEERSRPVSSIPTWSESSWWNSLERDELVRYGVRPFNTTPYVYLGTRAGHNGGKPLFEGEIRGGYGLFGSSHVECRLALNLSKRCRLVGGVSTDPLRLSSRAENPTSASMRFDYITGPKVHPNIFSVGVQTNDLGISADQPHENRLVVSYWRSW